MQIYEEKSAEFVDFASEMRGFESKEQKELEILELLGKYVLLFIGTGEEGVEHTWFSHEFRLHPSRSPDNNGR